MEEPQGQTPPPAAPPASHPERSLEPLVPPPPPPTRRERLTRAGQLFLALLLNIAFIVALFYRPEPIRPPEHKEPPAISVQLVPPQEKPQPKEQPKAQEQPKPQPEKPKEAETLIGSGDVTKKEAGTPPKVKADQSKEKPQVAAKKPKPEAPKEKEADLPDWAKKVASGYGLPEPKKSSIDKSRGATSDELQTEKQGEGGGDAYSNQLKAQIAAHTFVPPDMYGRAGKAVIAIVIDRTGALRGMRVVQSSGLREFDMIVMEGVRSAAPFRPLPSGSPEMVQLWWEAQPKKVE